MAETVQAGTLYLVSTPIGNLEELSRRAESILRGVDLVAAEDTRTTRVLLEHYDIHVELVSYHTWNENRRTPELIGRLLGGASIALVSDAGTPGISDPAYRIVRSAIDAGCPVLPVPGPSALLAALVVSGLPMDRFLFEGFLPQKKGRATRISRLGTEERTIVLYESPHRLLKTLKECRAVMGERQISVSREITKRFEETVRGTFSDVISRFEKGGIKGEFVVVIGPPDFHPELSHDRMTVEE